MACVAFSWRKVQQDNAREISVVLSAALFAALFENLNVLQVHGRGSYSYNAKFHVFIGQVPLFIILAWSVILWTAMQISASTTLRIRYKIIGDAVLAVLLDLSFDATAIRHDFWFWHGFAFNQGWFGVPAGNFFGWMFVALAFSFCTRSLDWCVQNGKLQARFRAFIQLVLVPIVAFVFYRAVEATNNAMLTIFGWRADLPSTDRFALGIFFAQFFALMLWTVFWTGRPRTTTIEYSNAQTEVHFARMCRIFFHGFALCGLFALPVSSLLAQQKPALLAVAGLVCLLDWGYEKRLRTKRVISRAP